MLGCASPTSAASTLPHFLAPPTCLAVRRSKLTSGMAGTRTPNCRTCRTSPGFSLVRFQLQGVSCLYMPVSMVLLEGSASGWSRQPPWPTRASFRPRLPCSAVPLLLPVSRVCTSTSEIGSCQCRTTQSSSDIRFCHCSSRSARACNGSSGSGVVWRWGLEVQEWKLSLVLGALMIAWSYHECLVPRCFLPTAAQSAKSTPAYTELLQLPSPECVPPLQKIGSCQCHTTKLSSDVRFCHCWSRSARACNGSSGSGRVLPWGLEVGVGAVMSPWCHAVPCLQLLRALDPRLPKSLSCCSCRLRSVYLHSSRLVPVSVTQPNCLPTCGSATAGLAL